jgi:hypothetical protein
MANQGYKGLEIVIISFEHKDIMTVSGDGENFGAVMEGWGDAFIGGAK